MANVSTNVTNVAFLAIICFIQFRALLILCPVTRTEPHDHLFKGSSSHPVHLATQRY